MMRSVLSFFSMLALGVMALAAVALALPWVQGRWTGEGNALGGLQFESALVGLSVGLLLGTISHYHWADIPRRIVAWFLIRERLFFYYVLIAGCIAVLLFY